MDWYKNWHNHPRHRHAHLVIFFSVLFVVIMFLFVGFFDFYLEKNSIATAQTPCDSSVIFPNIVSVCDIAPRSVKPGDTVRISGYFMSNVVQLSNDIDGSIESIEGTGTTSHDLIVFAVPLGTPDGIYGISIASVDGASTGTSNINLTIAKNPNILPPQPPPAQLPLNQQPSTPIANPPATNFQDIISNAFNYSIMFVGIAVFIMILWGGFLWLTSSANPGNIATAKGYIFNAIMGGVLLLSAYVILYTINPELVGGTFNLKGIEVPTTQATGVTNVIATDEVGAASAINAGCTINLDTRDFTALECESDIAEELNLLIDPIITTSDINVNNQIGAITIQSGGNQGTGRKIIILDTGYNYQHPELSSSYLGGKDFINNDSDPIDDHTTGTGAPGHGSHVAGIITADGIDPRARGVAPGVGIIAGKILGKDGTGKWSYMTEAIYWAVNGPDGTFGTSDDFKADIINISVGGGSYVGMCDTTDETTRLSAKAIQYAKDNGVLVVISSGNVSSGISMPGCIDASFTVGAVDGSSKIASFSGRGSSVDIVAPGVNIYSSLLGNNYGTKSGTSMATPVVSGVAALIKTANPSLTAYELEQKITSTACDLGSAGKDTTFGWGRITAVPGSCTASNQQPPSGITATGSISPTTCTKGLTSLNPDCNINLSYTITGIRSPTTLTIKKDNNSLQSIQCNSSPCTAQLTDPNPSSGVHRYNLSLPDNSIIAGGNAYIYTLGNINANFGSCIQLADSNNPKCDITLTISALGVYPNSIIVTKDGSNWRIVKCTDPQCASSLTDLNPSVGTHTFSIRDALDNTNARLGRVTVVISPPSSNIPTCEVQSNETLELCTGTNYTGTCAQFNCRERTNFVGSSINGQMIKSARITRTGSGESDARLFICDTGWVHPYTTQTEPVHCMWKDINSTTQASDIWDPNARDWCYWDWVGSSGVTTCGQPPPGPSVLIVPGATITIKSYGSL